MAQTTAKPSDPRRKVEDALNFRDAVNIYVGSENELFSLPRSIATASSDRLHELLNDQQSTVYASQLDPFAASDFNTYVNWLHTGKLPLHTAAETPLVASGGKPEDREFVELVGLHRLGVSLSDYRFVDSVMDAFIAHLGDGELPGEKCIEAVFDSVGSEDQLRRLLVAAYAKVGDGVQLETLRDKVPAAFFTDVCLALCGTREPSKFEASAEGNCDSHYHTGYEGCSGVARPAKRARVEVKVEDEDEEDEDDEDYVDSGNDEVDEDNEDDEDYEYGEYGEDDGSCTEA